MWTSGVAPHPFVTASPLPKDGRGWVTVDAHLRVPGFPGVWALGDCARVPDILHTMSFRPDFLAAIMDASRLHFSDGALTRAQHEMIASYVSALNRCRY